MITRNCWYLQRALPDSAYWYLFALPFCFFAQFFSSLLLLSIFFLFVACLFSGFFFCRWLELSSDVNLCSNWRMFKECCSKSVSHVLWEIPKNRSKVTPAAQATLKITAKLLLKSLEMKNEWTNLLNVIDAKVSFVLLPSNSNVRASSFKLMGKKYSKVRMTQGN